MSFDGKVVLITGASSGIGTATALHFAKLGANLSLCGRNKASLDEVAEKCESLSKKKPIVVTGDLTSSNDVAFIMDTTIKHFLTLDVLVNNAGILELGSIETTSLEQFDKLFSINTRALFHLTMLAVPYLIKSKGTIVNVSSVNGLRAFPGVLVYNMTKAAVDQFTRTLALELASKKVRVNSVNPGVIRTELHKRAGLEKEAYEKFLEKCQETHPIGRPGEPGEVATAIAFLASKEAGFITGVTLSIDGGRGVACPR